MTDQPAPRRVSWAERNQGAADEQDELLTVQARRNHPTCAFWWGRIIEGGSARAQCYICGARMVTFASKWPLTDEARRRIHKHRTTHLALPASTITTPGDTQ